jgi:nucleoid DNA-binding protein
MNKTELITAAAEAAGIQKKDAERFMNAALDIVAQSLRKGEKVQLSGFGTFEVKQRQARMGRNPKTREAVEIPPARVPDFKPSQNLKEIVK